MVTAQSTPASLRVRRVPWHCEPAVAKTRAVGGCLRAIPSWFFVGGVCVSKLGAEIMRQLNKGVPPSAIEVAQIMEKITNKARVRLLYLCLQLQTTKIAILYALCASARGARLTSSRGRNSERRCWAGWRLKAATAPAKSALWAPTTARYAAVYR